MSVNPPTIVGRTIDPKTGKPAVTVPLQSMRHTYGPWVVRVVHRRQQVGAKLALALFMAAVSTGVWFWWDAGGPYALFVICAFITGFHLLGAIVGGLSILLAEDDDR